MTAWPSLFSALNIARVGMSAQQSGMSITGHNVANVNTEGFTRRRIALGAVAAPPFGGNGVEVLGVKRYADDFATSRLIREETLFGYSNQKMEILSHVSDLFNDLEDTGLGKTLDSFYGSLRLLETNPGDLTIRQEVLARAQELVNSFNRISQEIDTVRTNTDNLLRGSVAEINIRTEELANLNRAYQDSVIKGDDTTDIIDRREQLLREIAEHVNISSIGTTTGQVTVMLEGGLPLVEGYSQTALRVLQSAAPGTARVEYVTGNQISDITGRIDEGSMGAVLELRNNLLPSMSQGLDEIAFDLITAYNAQHSVGFGLDGLNGRDMFTSLATSNNAAQLMELDAAIATDPSAIAAASNPLFLPGDNINALALAEIADLNVAAAGTQTINEAYATIVGEVGVEARRAGSETSMRATSISRIESIRDSQSGVSLDEEMTNLIQYQRAYQASSRVLSTINETLQTLISMV